MLSRGLGLTALVTASIAIAGCGGVAATETIGNQLTIYSSLPLQGPSAPISRQIIGGEKLALRQAGGHIGRFRVSYVSLDDANARSGQPTPGESSTAAKEAAKDTTTIAYLGDFGSAATAISLPIMNEAGILQVSPDSPYVGLTSSLDAGQYEPNRFYPSGMRNFARLQPGDQVQAAAQARLMRSLGVSRVYVLDNQDPFEMPLGTLVASDAVQAGIGIAGRDSLPTPTESNFAGEVEKILATHPEAVFLAGGGNPGAAALWRALHAAAPHLLLLGCSSMANEAFSSAIGPAASQTYMTTPLLGVASYPPDAKRVLDSYRAAFRQVGGPWVLYGYEAMSVVLQAIRRAGSRGNNRPDVIRSLMATRNRASVIGRYSVQADGDTTLASYGVDRVAAGKPVFYRAIDTAAPIR